MTCLNAVRATLRAALIVAVPLQLLAAQKAAPPQDQARLLRESADNMYERALTPVETSVRDDIVLMRDTLGVAGLFANRITRAVATNTQSVMISNARQLKPACAAGARAVAAMRPHFDKLNLRAKDKDIAVRSNAVLKEYRSALAAVETLMTNCDRDLTPLIAAAKPDAARISKIAGDVGTGILNYEARVRITLNHFDIPLRSQQQVAERGVAGR